VEELLIDTKDNSKPSALTGPWYPECESRRSNQASDQLLTSIAEKLRVRERLSGRLDGSHSSIDGALKLIEITLGLSTETIVGIAPLLGLIGGRLVVLSRILVSESQVTALVSTLLTAVIELGHWVLDLLELSALALRLVEGLVDLVDSMACVALLVALVL
jgi:hypothetical protein